MKEIIVRVIHNATEALGYNGVVESFIGMDADFIDGHLFTIMDLYEKALLAGTHKIVIEGRDKPAENFYGDEGFL